MSLEACLYTPPVPPLSREEIERLAVEGARFREGEKGELVVSWPEAQFTIFPATPQEEVAEHLQGFLGWVDHLSGGADWTEPLRQQISMVRTVVGCRINSPGKRAVSNCSPVGILSPGLSKFLEVQKETKTTCPRSTLEHFEESFTKMITLDTFRMTGLGRGGWRAAQGRTAKPSNRAASRSLSSRHTNSRACPVRRR